jgi:hypothetical protein
MADAPEKKIFVDDDWKAEAEREKERLAGQAGAQPRQEKLPPASIAELINLLAMQALAGLGLLTGPNGERMPPQLELAKHFIDLLQTLEDKTRGNLTPEEKKMFDQVLYEIRMHYVQAASGGMPSGMP